MLSKPKREVKGDRDYHQADHAPYALSRELGDAISVHSSPLVERARDKLHPRLGENDEHAW